MSHQSLTDNPPQVIRSPWRDFLHAFVRNPLALVSGGFVLSMGRVFRCMSACCP